MKLRNYIIAGLTLAAATLQSCEKEVANFDISTKPLLVTTAFISPQDTLLTVDLKLTQPAIGKQLSQDQLLVKDATVTLSDGLKQVQLEYNAEHGKYFAPITSLPVIAGKAYFLRVTTPAGEKAEAECVVPSLAGIGVTELNYTTELAEEYGNSWLYHQVSFKWQDAPGVENYYYLSSYRTVTRQFGYPPVLATYYEPAHTDRAKIFVKDTGQDGSIMQSPNFSLMTLSEDHAPKPFPVYAVLAVTDKAYYDYHQSVQQQDQNGGNPFAEPSRIYSNMRGSLGVFAAYNQIKVVRIVE